MSRRAEEEVKESLRTVRNGISVDVEDYFHAEAVTSQIGRDAWISMPSRVIQNTHRVLDLLGTYNTRATFFVLGWVANRYPKLVQEIYSQGHEIGCHSYWHRLVYTLTPAEFREDTRRAKDSIESTIAAKILGYRAPSFSVTKRSAWALEILSELGFQYDSSVFPIRHNLYGIPDHPRFPSYYGQQEGWKLIELPISTWRLGSINLPFGGGGYLRILPLAYTHRAFRSVNQGENQPVVVYFHPWEMDPEQPRLELSIRSRFRQYTNLNAMTRRIVTLLKNYPFVPLCKLLEHNPKSNLGESDANIEL